MSSLSERFQILKEAHQTAGVSFYQARKEQLKALAKALKKNQKKLCDAVNKDFGHRAKEETQVLEIISTIESIQYTLKHLQSWMMIKNAKLPWWFRFGSAKVLHQPVGIVGIIVPWNYPIHLALEPMIAALASGNRVMIKMSSLTPNTSSALEKLLSEVFSMQEVQVVAGGGSVNEEFITLPFDHLFFTGSNEIGKKIFSKLSKNLTPMTLELGGKSPVLIADNFPIDVAVDRIMAGKLVNGGQTCIAPDYVLLQKASSSLFVDFAKSFVKKSYPNISSNVNYTSIINAERFKRLHDLLHDAESHGAQIVPLCEAKDAAEKNKFIPHIVLNVSDKMKLMQEEIFGPILPVLTYENFQEAIEYVRTKPAPLALYIFDENNRRANDIIEKIPSGGVTVNDTMLHAGSPSLPFGGIGQSGMGKYHGKAGFDLFTHYRSVFYQSSINLLGFARPPFGKLIKRFIKWKL